ncbi:MAG: ABC transporter ATP-binding protein [Lachnospiraceae bacterium]|uniref:ABC transporter ATP-binding protein n=1 Tax=Roseburia sp. 1XD42-69 TaxID=2320088 RepID=UPI000EA15381|nr:ABC transporter ATP-binding protein [Roseburia sp. 1XD42-69]MCI8876645.1 ABC transporter ATP-binding protein [Lachnospiraceae bacterium]MCX4320014.1 ABC transporter ATP-binding protein [Lachnospiraceae bacterium]RKJ64656.1 ABC transporter ATP-binding protein [Roseburia sp. 1XD42-69]
MITVTGLSKSYNGKKVVDDLSFTMKEGKLFALLGSNGAGKSTTIKMMLSLVKKDGGRIEIPEDALLGYSPETPYFPPFLTGMEVLLYYGVLQKIPREKLKVECGTLLHLVGLSEEKTKIKFYSKGMLQRLALAQAMLGNPSILILDEPCAGLDAMGRIEMIELIMKLKTAGKTILMNSHILSDIEKVCDEGMIMQKGKVLRRFTKEDLRGGESLETIFTKTISGGIEK